jgi:hypothetical protein
VFSRTALEVIDPARNRGAKPAAQSGAQAGKTFLPLPPTFRFHRRDPRLWRQAVGHHRHGPSGVERGRAIGIWAPSPAPMATFGQLNGESLPGFGEQTTSRRCGSSAIAVHHGSALRALGRYDVDC